MKIFNNERLTGRSNASAGELLGLFIFIAAIQILRLALSRLVYLSVEHNEITDMAFRYVFRVLFTVAFVHMAGREGLFPKRFGALYITVTVSFILFLVSAPFVTGEKTIEAIFMLIFSAVITPAFEETIFRGFIWKRLEGIFSCKWMVLLFDTLLFGLWHIGFADVVIWHMNMNGLAGNIVLIMFFKVITGFGYGAILGFVRMKTGNAYLPIILHGIMNVIAA